MHYRDVQYWTFSHLDGVLADTESVPQLDGLISRSRHDLTVVGREGDAQDILGVTDKPTSRLATVSTGQNN